MGIISPVIFSAALSDSEPIQAVTELKVVDIGVNSFSLSWRKTPRASGYKISWVPFLGKRQHTDTHTHTHTHTGIQVSSVQ